MVNKSNKYNDDYYYQLARLNIKKYRTQKNYTTQELADKCDLTHQFIRDLECIKLTRRPRLDTLGRIANALDIDIRDLFTPIEEDKKNKSDDK